MGKSTDGGQDGSSKSGGGWANVRGKLGISMRQPTHATSDYMKIAESMFRYGNNLSEQVRTLSCIIIQRRLM